MISDTASVRQKDIACLGNRADALHRIPDVEKLQSAYRQDHGQLYGFRQRFILLTDLLLSVLLTRWILRNGLKQRTGFCPPGGKPSVWLFWSPLILAALARFLRGAVLPSDPSGTLLRGLELILAGYLEELLFRGLLFRALEPRFPRSAALIASLAFALSHLANLFSGAAPDIPAVLLQSLYAFFAGLALTLLFRQSGSLIPCILFHSVNNALDLFTPENTFSPRADLPMALFLCLLTGAYAYYLSRLPKKAPASGRP